ncbi:MAG: hypothetical protein II052_01540 [Prevotella sp.]|nr:hypothetical protein [Prevotella sp.]
MMEIGVAQTGIQFPMLSDVVFIMRIQAELVADIVLDRRDAKMNTRTRLNVKLSGNAIVNHILHPETDIVFRCGQPGKLALNVRKLAVKAKYTQFPDTLDIDVTSLGLGKSMKVSALSFEGLHGMFLIVTRSGSPQLKGCGIFLGMQL